MDSLTIARLRELSSELGRKPTAAVSITWGGGSVDSAVVDTAHINNRASITHQVAKSPTGKQNKWLFCGTGSSASISLLDGTWRPMPTVEHNKPYHGIYLVGWWGGHYKGMTDIQPHISDASGSFFPRYPVLTIRFPTMTILNFVLFGYLSDGDPFAEWPTAFDVHALYQDGSTVLYNNGEPAVVSIDGNDIVKYRGQFAEPLKGVQQLKFVIRSWSHPHAFVKITSAFDDYIGVYEANEIMSLSILEETDGAVGTLPIGNISANEMTLTLQNITDNFLIGNPTAEVGAMMRKGRRVEPRIGFIGEGEPPGNALTTWDDADTWDDNSVWLDYPPAASLMIPKGVYWTQTWDAAEDATGATTTALDRIGLLRDVEYNGIGNIGNPEGIAEGTIRRDVSLYALTEEILTDLRINYMPDLEWDIDGGLNDIVIPCAFFKRQSYFDVIKTIAQAAVAFAYMDKPTEAEYNAAAARGNNNCADVLRIKKLENFAPDADVANEFVTNKDILGKNIRVLPETVVNYITVPYNRYEVGANSGEIVHIEGDGGAIIGVADNSILEYGKSAHELDDNTLIQTPEHAEMIVNAILDAFAGAPRVAEVTSFGDVTRSIGDIIDLPEYAKRGANARGRYIITRIQTEFDGGIRQTLTCRRALDAPIERGDG